MNPLQKKIIFCFLISGIFFLNLIPGVLATRTLPLPRFVSLKSSEVNLRVGPGPEYPIEWIFKREKMPVEILTEFESWRRIKDFEGAEGWVHQSMLSGLRTVLVIGDKAILRKNPQENAAGIFHLEIGVIAKLMICKNNWCRLQIQGHKGWLPRHKVWGVYPHEFQK